MENLEDILKNDLQRIKDTIKDNRNKAMVIVNSAMIMAYYKIGTIINERKVWGNKYIERLSNELKEYGKGYSYDQLKRMSQFSSNFSVDEIMEQPVPLIPWGTILLIMKKSKSHEEMLYYINEKDLKNQMIDNVIKFLQELGPGFALVGKEYKLVTPTNKEFYIDLLLYHTKLHCYVVIEVKLNEFNPSDLGQLIFYVNAIDDLEKTNMDDETIGLLLCKEADGYVAKTSLNKNQIKLGISKYEFIDELEEYLKRKMVDYK